MPLLRLLVVAVDVEIHPFTLRRDLELLVAADALVVRPDERLGDVPVPEPRRLRGRVGSGLRFSSSYGQMYSRYRCSFVHRERISVGGPGIGWPALSRCEHARRVDPLVAAGSGRARAPAASRRSRARVGSLAAAEKTRTTNAPVSAGIGYLTASRSMIATVLKPGTQNSVVLPGCRRSRQRGIRRRAVRRELRRLVASAAREREWPADPAALLAPVRSNASRYSRARLPSPVRRAITVLGAVEPHQALVVAELRAHARGKLVRVRRRLPREVRRAELHRQVERAIGRRHHPVEQIAPRQQIQHFAHHAAIDRRRRRCSPARAAAAGRAAFRNRSILPSSSTSAGSGLRMASTLKANASAAASGADPAGSFA